MTQIRIAAILMLFACTAASGQTSRYRSAMLLHHSVGGCFWDRSQYSNLTPPTTIPKEIASYNSSHGYTGTNAVSMSEEYAPDPSSLNNNNWYRWEYIFSGTDQYVSLSSLLSYPMHRSILVPHHRVCVCRQVNMVQQGVLGRHRQVEAFVGVFRLP